MARTSIQISPRLRRRLERLKEHPRETYEDVIARELSAAEGRPAAIATSPVSDAIAAFKAAAGAIYGERLVKLLLYGSRARGDAHEDSDVDVLVVVRDEVAPGREIDRLVDTLVEIQERHGVAVSPVVMSRLDFLTKVTPLLLNVRAEGVAL